MRNFIVDFVNNFVVSLEKNANLKIFTYPLKNFLKSKYLKVE